MMPPFVRFPGLRRWRAGAAALALIGFGLAAMPAAAQNAPLEPRVKKLEAEMRAVQRKVFPGGSDKFFEPEITAPQTAPQPSGIAASNPLSDLLLRVDSLETQLARITAATEEQRYKQGQLEDRIAALEAKAKAAEAAAAPVLPGSGTATGTAPAGGGVPGGSASGGSVSGGNKAPPIAVAAPSPERIAAVSAIVKPQSSDAGEDEYIYGYRLWEAKFFPEAQAQLKAMVDKYPKHARISHARNLLGRAYLDDGKPSSAAKVFVENYEKDPRGERAPDSLYFLGEALLKLNEKAKACTAFSELADVYPDVAAGRLADRLAAGRRNAGCK